MITFSWQTTNAETVSLSNVDNGDSLPVDGSITHVIPTDLQFPSNGSGVNLTFTLTASNDNGIISQGQDTTIQSVTQSVTINVSQTAAADDGVVITPGGGDSGSDGDGTDDDGDGGGTIKY